MKRYMPLVFALCLSLGYFGGQACAHANTSQLSAAGNAAYTADQIVVRVNELENAAIAADAARTLSDTETRTIVEFCVAADKTLAAVPDGWRATVLQAWKAAKAKLPMTPNTAIAAAVAAMDLVLGAL